MSAALPADVDRIFSEALSRGDPDGALAMYEDDACYVEGDGTAARGRKQIRASLAKLVALRPTLNCYEIDVVENDDIALLRARWTFTGTNPDGTSFERHGRSIEVVRRQPDGT